MFVELTRDKIGAVVPTARRDGPRHYALNRKAIVTWSVAIFFLGVAVRLVLALWLDYPQHCPRPEPVDIAVSLATHGTYADAYGVGVGPTAHCAPLLPLFLSLLIRIFGVSVHAAVAMIVAASVASALAFALLPGLAVRTGLPAVCGVIGGVVGALLPFNFRPQTHGTFDAPFTAAVLVGLCILVCRIREKGRLAKREGVLLGIATGLGSLVSPAIIPVIAGWFIFLLVEQRRKWKRILIFSAAVCLCFVGTLSPWAIRNYEVLGSLIWTRSDFWLEMQVSNNDWMSPDEGKDLYTPAFARLHPHASPMQRAKVKRLGEVAYMRFKRKRFLAWLATHKRRFEVLIVERFRLFWIPAMARLPQTMLEAALTILGFGGLVLLFRSGTAFAWIFASLMVLFPDVYYLIMVAPRFRFPLEPFLFLLAAYFCYGLGIRVCSGRFSRGCGLSIEEEFAPIGHPSTG